MLAVNSSTLQEDLESYCDKAANNDEIVVVTRKKEKNVVILSLDKYNQIMKAAHNAEYLSMIDRGIEQLSTGKGQHHELIEVEEDE